MRVRLGIWHDEVAIFFATYMPEQYVVELDPTLRELRIMKGSGGMMYNDTAVQDTEFPWRLDAVGCDRKGFSRCCLMEVDMVEHHNGWSAVLPANHLLPWPQARDCESYSRAEELMRECVLRKNSADAAGEHMLTPPASIQMELTPAMRVTLFS